jgi:DNA-binding CsgD family transcriptional regulator
MNSRMSERRRAGDEGDILDVLGASDSPAYATDLSGHIIFWNHAAERLLGRTAGEVLGRRCWEVMAGRDVWGNRHCHENCTVVAMVRRGEPVRGFEVAVGATPQAEQCINVTVLKLPGERPEAGALVHILQPVDRATRLARALERLGASGVTLPSREEWERSEAPKPPPLTDREAEILRWVAAGLQNKEVAAKLGISLATVRNHIHNILEKLDVHSKLEAVSLAFRQGWVSAPFPEGRACRGEDGVAIDR